MNHSNINRRSFIQKSSVLGAGALLAGQFPFIKTHAEDGGDELVVGHGDFRYKVNREWGNLDPVKTPVFNCHEMVMDSKKRLIMVTDEVKNNIIVYDKSGKLLDSWGSRWPGGHGLTLSQEGEEDFLFIADCGWYYGFGRNEEWNRQSGTISKTTTDGRLVFTIGHPQTIGVYEKGQTFMPTEVAVAPNGDFYVADGYGSDFILQYNHAGEFIRKFGGQNNSDKKHNLHNAHGIAVDLRDAENPVLIVTSRSENCFKRFTMDGRYLDTISMPGAYICRPVVSGDNLYTGVCWSKKDGTGPRLDNSGFVSILDKDNKVVSNPGGTEPCYEEEALKPMSQAVDLFHHCHDVCVDNDDDLYVCQWKANKTYPIKLERV